MAEIFISIIWLCLLVFTSAHPQPSQDFRTMIVGGEPAKEGEIPYQISVRQYGSHVCGGSLVVIGQTQIVLSAAHCFVGERAIDFDVIAGELKRSDTTGNEQVITHRRQVTNIILHEGSQKYKHPNDIAILTIDAPFQLNNFVQPIPLPLQFQNTTGEVITSGWGRTYYADPFNSDILLKIQVPVVDDDTCQRCYSWMKILPSMICAGLVEEGGRDSCGGDSGGPLRAVDGDYLAGIVSFGRGCALPGYPGVYTEVSHFRDWIEAKVKSSMVY